MLVDLDFSILPGMDTKDLNNLKTDSGLAKLLGEYSFEHKGLLIYEKSETFRLLTGYKFCMENILLELNLGFYP